MDGAAAFVGYNRSNAPRRPVKATPTTAAAPASPMTVTPRYGRSSRWARVQALGACATPRAYGIHTTASKRSMRVRATSVGAPPLPLD